MRKPAMQKSLLVFGTMLVAALVGVLLWPKPTPSICADEVRSFEEVVRSSLALSAKELADLGVHLEGSTAKSYVDKLTKLTPSDLLAIKACDTQCRLLERCLTQHHDADIATACPSEYADYKKRVDVAMTVMSAIQKYEAETKAVAGQVTELTNTEKQLADVKQSVGAVGGRQAVLEQRLTAQQQQLESQVATVNTIAQGLVVANAPQ